MAFTWLQHCGVVLLIGEQMRVLQSVCRSVQLTLHTWSKACDKTGDCLPWDLVYGTSPRLSKIAVARRPSTTQNLEPPSLNDSLCSGCSPQPLNAKLLHSTQSYRSPRRSRASPWRLDRASAQSLQRQFIGSGVERWVPGLFRGAISSGGLVWINTTSYAFAWVKGDGCDKL